jgi:N-acetylglucosamine kinase-like BadF-type ATPase
MAGSRAGQAAAGPEHGEIAAGLSAAGVAASFVVESDLLAMFCAGSSALGGYAMVAGTGAAAIRVRDGEVDAVADGAGWLLGDDGSGFWIGQRVARGVVAALDGRSPSTGMTPLVLARLGIGGTDAQGRSPLNQLTSIVYSMRPVELAQLAPVAFGLDDDLARGIVSDAAEALVRTLAAVVDDRTDGPLVLGGSVLLHQATVGAGVESFFRSRGGDEVVRVVDGVVGAAVLALRRRGTDVDSEVFTRVRDSLAALRER